MHARWSEKSRTEKLWKTNRSLKWARAKKFWMYRSMLTAILKVLAPVWNPIEFWPYRWVFTVHVPPKNPARRAGKIFWSFFRFLLPPPSGTSSPCGIGSYIPQDKPLPLKKKLPWPEFFTDLQSWRPFFCMRFWGKIDDLRRWAEREACSVKTACNGLRT